MEISNNEIQGYLGWSDERLLAEIGRELEQRDWLPAKFDTLVRNGSAWMEANFERIREKVCAELSTAKDKDDSALLVATIADALAGLLGKPALLAAAVLVYRFGVGRLCDG